MIIITLQDNTNVKYNMPLEREKAFMDAWYAMRGDPSFTDKKFRIKLADTAVRLVRIGDIKLCQQAIDMVENSEGVFESEQAKVSS